MKTLIISDTHGNIANLKHVMGFAKKIRTSAIIHCGDWENVETIKTVLEYEIPLYSVLGNADIDPNIEKLLEGECKKFDQNFLRIELGRKKIGVIHDIRSLKTDQHLDIVFHGHSHRQSEWIKDGIKIINPGSLENSTNFAIYDLDSNKVEFIHE